MKIAVVHPRMSILGGGERVAIHSLTAGLQAGHEVCLVSEDFDATEVEGFFACEGLFSKVNRLTYPVFRPRLFGGLLLYRQLYYHRKQIRKLLSKHSDFQVVLSTQDIGYVPSTRAPVVQYCYFPDYFSHVEASPTSHRWRLYYVPARRYYHDRVNHVDRFLSTSNYTAGFIKKVWGRDSTTLYPPCPIELYKSIQSLKENLVVTVGRIVPEKRMETFVEIARQLPLLKFVVIGSVQPGRRDYYEFLRKMASSNVSFLNTPLRKASDILARAKVYVHCAQNEQFGIAIVEAMAAGCIPVVHDSGGPREIVTDDVGFRWNTAAEAVGLVTQLFENDVLHKRMSRAASTRANSFGSEIFESRLSEILEEYREDRNLSGTSFNFRHHVKHGSYGP
jgi:glycosyltransferase involved in cell wall biosynthesis